jgi:hypothetical protein
VTEDVTVDDTVDVALEVPVVLPVVVIVDVWVEISHESNFPSETVLINCDKLSAVIPSQPPVEIRTPPVAQVRSDFPDV